MKKLTKREQEALIYIVQGENNHAIAQRLVVSHHTAKAYVSGIFQKLGVTSRVQAAVKAVRENLV